MFEILTNYRAKIDQMLDWHTSAMNSMDKYIFLKRHGKGAYDHAYAIDMLPGKLQRGEFMRGLDILELHRLGYLGQPDK